MMKHVSRWRRAWRTRQGRISVDVAVTGIGAGAVAVTAVPFARALRRHDMEEGRTE